MCSALAAREEFTRGTNSGRADDLGEMGAEGRLLLIVRDLPSPSLGWGSGKE